MLGNVGLAGCVQAVFGEDQRFFSQQDGAVVAVGAHFDGKGDLLRPVVDEVQGVQRDLDLHRTVGGVVGDAARGLAAHRDAAGGDVRRHADAVDGHDGFIGAGLQTHVQRSKAAQHGDGSAANSLVQQPAGFLQLAVHGDVGVGVVGVQRGSGGRGNGRGYTGQHTDQHDQRQQERCCSSHKCFLLGINGC